MLKLEPTEAERVVIGVPPASYRDTALDDVVDSLFRRGRAEEALSLVDREILLKHVGLSESDIDVLRDASDMLVSRRGGRRRRP